MHMPPRIPFSYTSPRCLSEPVEIDARASRSLGLPWRIASHRIEKIRLNDTDFTCLPSRISILGGTLLYSVIDQDRASEMSAADILPLLQTIVARLNVIEAKIASGSVGDGSGASSSGGAAAEELPRSIRGFDAYYASSLVPFVAAAEKLGGDAAVVGNLIKDAWDELRSFLVMASACKEPSQDALRPILTNFGAKLKAVSGAVNRNEWEKHTKTCSEGVGCLNW
jgi:hypothetical protein